MKNVSCEDFQDAVSQYLVRHRSILDVISKFQVSSARVNRTLTKAVTSCGCLNINAKKQELPSEISLAEMQKFFSSHLKGPICESCKEKLEAEMGNVLFYLTAMCELLNVSLQDIVDKEERKISTLGFFNLT